MFKDPFSAIDARIESDAGGTTIRLNNRYERQFPGRSFKAVETFEHPNAASRFKGIAPRQATGGAAEPAAEAAGALAVVAAGDSGAAVAAPAPVAVPKAASNPPPEVPRRRISKRHRVSGSAT